MDREELLKNIHNIDDLNKAIEKSTNETNHLLEELDQLETARRGGSLSSVGEYEKEKSSIEKYLLREQEKLALLSSIQLNYNRIMEIYDILRTTRKQEDFDKLLNELTGLLDTLPLEMKDNLEQTHILNEKRNRIIEIKATSIEEVHQLLEASLKETQHLNEEMKALEEATRTDNLHPNNYYIKEKETIDFYLEKEQEKQAIYKQIIDSYNKIIELYEKSVTIQDENEYNELINETNALKQLLPPEIRRSIESRYVFSEELNRIIKISAESKEEIEQLLEKTKNEIEHLHKEMEALEESVRTDNLYPNKYYIQEKTSIEQHLKIEEAKLVLYTKMLEEMNKVIDSTIPVSEVKRDSSTPEQVLIDAVQEELDKQQQQEKEKEKNNQEMKNKIKELLNNKKEDIDKYSNQFNTEINNFNNKDLEDNNKNYEKAESNYLNNLNDINDNYKDAKNEYNNIKDLDDAINKKDNDRKYENETEEELLRQLEEHTENRKRIAKQLQDTYNKIKDFKLNNVLGTMDEVNDFYSLFGPNGPLAKLESELNKEDEIISSLKDRLGIKDLEPEVKRNTEEPIEPVVPNIEDEQQKDDIKDDEPKVDEPKVDEPKVDEPKVDEPKVDEPKVDEPVVSPPDKGKEPLGLPGGKEPLGLPGEVEPKGKDPEPKPIEPTNDNKPQQRSLNTILADIITDPETKQPVNITRRQRKRLENSQISVSKRFASQISNKNVIYNLLSVAPAIVSLPISLFQKLSGKILTTRRTKKNMKIVRENLNRLSVSDLKVLESEYKGNTAISERGMIGIDGLIQERIERFRYERIELERASMKALYDKVLADYTRFRNTNDLLRSINERRISDSELNRLMEENHAQSRNHLTRILKERCDSCIRGKAAEIKEIRRLRTEIENEYSNGLHGHEEDFRAKSTKMNEVGKRFAKDKSTADAYEFTRILGQLQDAEMEAIANNDDMEAMRLFMAIEKKQVMGTEQRRSIFGWRETGLTNYQPIPESLDYRQDPFVRNLLTTISIAGLTVGAIHEIQNRIAQANAQANAQAAANYQNAVNQHNQTNQSYSNWNAQQQQTINARGQEMAGRSDDISRGMQGQSAEAIAGRRAVDEYADHDLTGWSMNDQYHQLDDLHHAATQQAADHASQTLADIQSRLATGQITDVQALREMQAVSDSATQEFVEACQRAIPIAKQYAASHPQFEYAGYIDNLERFASDPSALQQLNEAAIRSVEIGQELQGVSIIPYEQLAETLQYLPVDVQSQLFALGSAALLTGRAASQAQYLRKHGAEYNEELMQRVEEIDRKDKERKKKQETEQMLPDDEQTKQPTGFTK